MYSSGPPVPGKMRFQLYVGRTMLWPSRNAATENSTGIVGTRSGVASGSTSLRPLVNTSSSTAGAADPRQVVVADQPLVVEADPLARAA